MLSGSASTWSRFSVPREGAALVFLAAVFEALGLEGIEASSAARRAAFSSFLRWASAALSAAASLFQISQLEKSSMTRSVVDMHTALSCSLHLLTTFLLRLLRSLLPVLLAFGLRLLPFWDLFCRPLRS